MTASFHLCVTHSPLVTRVFEAVVRRNEIPTTSIGYLSRRGTLFAGRGFPMDDVSDQLDLAYRKLDRKGYRATQQRLDEAIRSLCGGSPFEAYVPHLNKMLYQEVIGHPLCAGYSFLEEGCTSMTWDFRRNARITGYKLLRDKLRHFWIRPRYQLTRPMFDPTLPHYRSAFAISRLAFRGITGRVDVCPYLPPLPPGNPPGRIFLILDSSYLHQGLLWQNYEDAIVGVLREGAPHACELLVKFHFADPKSAERYQSLLARLGSSGFPSIQKLPGDFEIERNLTAADLLVFGTTSLGYYMTLAGCRSRCFAERIQGFRIDDWIARGDMPEDFPTVVGSGSG